MQKAALPQHSPVPLSRSELLRIDGRHVAVTLRLNPRARRLIVKVHPTTGEVSIIAPSKRSLAQALDFARRETDWIAKRLADVPAQVNFGIGAQIPFRGEMHRVTRGEAGSAPVWIEREQDCSAICIGGRSEHASRRLLDFLKREARKAIEAQVSRHVEYVGVRPSRITIRDTASRWGSCSTTRALSFSWRLILAPPFVLDYVVAHEVAHLRHMNHGVRFWALVRKLLGDVEAPQAWLSENGLLLHRYAPTKAM
jgi:predicted metal-dependent hydrolase